MVKLLRVLAWTSFVALEEAARPGIKGSVLVLEEEETAGSIIPGLPTGRFSSQKTAEQADMDSPPPRP